VLDSFVHQYQALKSRYKIPTNNKLINELVLSLNITSMRAEHRLNTLSYLIAYRLNKINKANKSIDDYLKIASTIRANANSLVKLQENLSYRYSLTNVAAKKKSKTVYNFGYLFPVSNLHFWEREELQAKNNKWKFYYKNIWDVLKIIGVKK
jgi:hypothetical protein